MRVAPWLTTLFLAYEAGALVVGCRASSQPPAAVSTPDARRVVQFEFTSPDGQRLASQELRGRVSLVLLVATHDMASQLMSRLANELLHTYTPRINVGAVIMEAPQYAELKHTYEEVLGLTYPVVMADHATLNGRGPLGEIDYIPTTLVLDRQGHEVERLRGPATREVVEEALEKAGRR